MENYLRLLLECRRDKSYVEAYNSQRMILRRVADFLAGYSPGRLDMLSDIKLYAPFDEFVFRAKSFELSERVHRTPVNAGEFPARDVPREDFIFVRFVLGFFNLSDFTTDVQTRDRFLPSVYWAIVVANSSKDCFDTSRYAAELGGALGRFATSLAYSADLNVEPSNLSELDGMLIKTRYQATILVAKRLSPTNRAFTVLHELAHYVLGHIPNTEYGFDSRLLDEEHGIPRFEAQENEADKLASAWKEVFHLVSAEIRRSSADLDNPTTDGNVLKVMAACA